VLEQTIFHWIREYGYAAIVFLLMLGIVGLPVPDETLLTFSGYLVFKAQLHWIPTMLAAFLGSVCGITLSYVLGRTFGLRLIHRYGPYIHITEDRLDRTHRWLEDSGAWSLTFGYYFPGIRHLTAYVAGTSGLSLHVFSLFAFGGALLWTATFVTAGYFMGDEWAKMSHDFHSYAWMLTALLGAALAILLGVRKALRKKRSTVAPGSGT
jgi:membrane protein DedA with SNARE-associated domain